jgi:ATP-dependent Lhr-like helicase
MAAMISLLTQGWFEPPRTAGVHLSTLVQQMLSVIAQMGGATIGQLYTLLCGKSGPFQGLSQAEFMDLARHLGKQELLVQESSGLLLHGSLGEKFVNHYSFYAVFAADEEFRIVGGGRLLGTLPVSQLLTPGQRILFAGKTWAVESVDEEQKTIYVTRAKGGTPPLFSGGGGRVHTRVRQEMRRLLESKEPVPYLDEVAHRFLDEGREYYAQRGLASEVALDQGREVLVLTWLGDPANEALAALLRRRGFQASLAGPGIEVLKATHSPGDILDALIDAAVDDLLTWDELLKDAQNLQREKWDWYLPEGLLRKSYASLHLDMDEARAWAHTLNR